MRLGWWQMGVAVVIILALARVAGAVQHCAFVETPKGGDRAGPIWEAIARSRVESVSCVLGGPGAVDLDILVGGATVNGGVPLRCTAAGVLVTAPKGATTLRVQGRLTLRIGAVTPACAGGAQAGRACTVASQCPGSDCTVASLLVCFATDR